MSEKEMRPVRLPVSVTDYSDANCCHVKVPLLSHQVSRFHSELSEVVSQHKSILKSAMAREVRKLAAVDDCVEDRE